MPLNFSILSILHAFSQLLDDQRLMRCGGATSTFCVALCNDSLPFSLILNLFSIGKSWPSIPASVRLQIKFTHLHSCYMCRIMCMLLMMIFTLNPILSELILIDTYLLESGMLGHLPDPLILYAHSNCTGPRLTQYCGWVRLVMPTQMRGSTVCTLKLHCSSLEPRRRVLSKQNPRKVQKLQNPVSAHGAFSCIYSHLFVPNNYTCLLVAPT